MPSVLIHILTALRHTWPLFYTVITTTHIHSMNQRTCGTFALADMFFVPFDWTAPFCFALTTFYTHFADWPRVEKFARPLAGRHARLRNWTNLKINLPLRIGTRYDLPTYWHWPFSTSTVHAIRIEECHRWDFEANAPALGDASPPELEWRAIPLAPSDCSWLAYFATFTPSDTVHIWRWEAVLRAAGRTNAIYEAGFPLVLLACVLRSLLVGFFVLSEASLMIRIVASVADSVTLFILLWSRWTNAFTVIRKYQGFGHPRIKYFVRAEIQEAQAGPTRLELPGAILSSTSNVGHQHALPTPDFETVNEARQNAKKGFTGSILPFLAPFTPHLESPFDRMPWWVPALEWCMPFGHRPMLPHGPRKASTFYNPEAIETPWRQWMQEEGDFRVVDADRPDVVLARFKAPRVAVEVLTTLNNTSHTARIWAGKPRSVLLIGITLWTAILIQKHGSDGFGAYVFATSPLFSILPSYLLCTCLNLNQTPLWIFQRQAKRAPQTALSAVTDALAGDGDGQDVGETTLSQLELGGDN